MRLIDAITDPGVARRILECLALPGRAAPLAPASELDLGSTIGGRDCDAASAEADSDPDFDFDQSADEDRTSNDASQGYAVAANGKACPTSATAGLRASSRA